MNPPSLARLYALRACYLMIIVGLGLAIWPSIIGLDAPNTLAQGIVRSMLGAVSVLALFGLRRPMRMLPLLVFEVVWKAIWTAAVAIPMWRAGRLDEVYVSTLWECAVVLIFVAIIPWGRFWRDFVAGPGDRWGSARPAQAEAPAA